MCYFYPLGLWKSAASLNFKRGLTMSKKIENSVINAIAKQKKLDPSSISIDSTLADLGISSLEAITVVYEIEEEFDVEVPSEKLEDLRTVPDIVAGIGELISAKT